jgi:pimeloyl-ACP methyl ester carboxylesterase
MKRIIQTVAVASALAAMLAGLRVSMRKQDSAPLGARRWVILVHGVLRSPSSMSRIERALASAGYSTVNFEYSSRKERVDDIAGRLNSIVQRIDAGDAETISFVTHSFGAIVVRYYLSTSPIGRLGRFVMIAPPNRGSEWARMLSRMPLYGWILGAAGEDVREAETAYPVIKRTPPCEFGVIAGGFGNRAGLNPLIAGDDDGTIAVRETALEGMKDFILVRGQHSTLLLQKSVIRNVVHFLEHGCFIRKK